MFKYELSDCFIASIAITIVDDPNTLLASSIKLGLLIAAVLIETLSAPERRTLLMSFKFLRPPPTVKGMKILFAVLVTISVRLFP